MLLGRIISALVLGFASLSAGCRQAPKPVTTREEPARSAVAVTSTVSPALNQTETPSQYTSQGGEAAAAPTGAHELEDVEERQGRSP
jgi:hypothetical protein